MSDITGGSTGSVLLPNLQAAWEYNITVKAYTSESGGSGNSEAEDTFNTTEAGVNKSIY